MPYDPREPYREADEADRLLRELYEQEQGKLDEQFGAEDVGARYLSGEEGLAPGLESFARRQVAQSRYETKSDLGKALALKRFRVRQQAKEKSRLYGEANRQEQEAKKSARRKALMNILGVGAGAAMSFIPGVGPALGLAANPLLKALQGATIGRGMGGMFGYGSEGGMDPILEMLLRRQKGLQGEGRTLSLSDLSPEEYDALFRQ